MLRGYYTAASGIVTQEKRLNTYANNITNASTVGYKKDSLISGVFGEHMSVRMNAYQDAKTTDIGPESYMQIISEKYTDDKQGTFEDTQRPMDMSIAGEGYFVVANEKGEFLTRDGQFSLDSEGYLILPGYGRVLGQNGELNIGTSSFVVGGDGTILVTPPDAEAGDEPTLLDKILVAMPDDPKDFDKASDSTYATSSYTPVSGAETDVLQGTLERSNVNMAEEMTRVIASQRALQSCSQIVKMYDDIAEKITTQVSRV